MRGLSSLLVLIILLIISISGCSFSNENEYSLEIEYLLEIVPQNNNTSYQLCCPIPMNRNGEISSINDYLEISKGDIQYSFTDSIHGIVINITGSGEAIILISIKEEKEYRYGDGFPILSMDKEYEDTGEIDDSDSNAEYYTFLKWDSEETVHILINLHIDYRDSSDEVVLHSNLKQSLEGDIVNGWNKINGEKSSWAI